MFRPSGSKASKRSTPLNIAINNGSLGFAGDQRMRRGGVLLTEEKARKTEMHFFISAGCRRNNNRRKLDKELR